MQNIVGQEKLVNKLNNYNINTLPHALLFIGPKGCGKHLIASYVAEKLALELVSIPSQAAWTDGHCPFQRQSSAPDSWQSHPERACPPPASAPIQPSSSE